eukprot:8991662-Pyramimonas_sp.AAC.1
MLQKKYALRSVSHVWKVSWRHKTPVSEPTSNALMGIPNALGAPTTRSLLPGMACDLHAKRWIKYSRT